MPVASACNQYGNERLPCNLNLICCRRLHLVACWPPAVRVHVRMRCRWASNATSSGGAGCSLGAYMQLQCGDGYTGNLCAACLPGYAVSQDLGEPALVLGSSSEMVRGIAAS